MISFVVSSYREDYFLGLEKSIKETVDSPFEIVKVENQNQYSLAEAYNIGAEKAKFKLLCFVHEDLIFREKAWDVKLISDMSKGNFSLLGLAGSKVVPRMPVGWTTGIVEYDKMYLMQDFPDGQCLPLSTQKDEMIDEVKILDGLFLFTTYEVWSKFRFNEAITGFHFYDLDFSKRVSLERRIGVTYHVLVQHFSMGNFDSNWVRSLFQYYRDYRRKDTGLDHLSESEMVELRRTWFVHLTRYKIDFGLRLKFVYKLGIDFRTIEEALSLLFPSFSNILNRFSAARIKLQKLVSYVR